jgi:hypothetical protein
MIKSTLDTTNRHSDHGVQTTGSPVNQEHTVATSTTSSAVLIVIEPIA